MQTATASAAEMEEMILLALNKAAELLHIEPEAEVSVVLTDDAYIQQLNHQYRGLDCATDVLSFALNEGDEPPVVDGPAQILLGDIVISLDTAARQAQEFGHSLAREVSYLAVHGLLHLLGYDHQEEENRAVMRAQEERILSALALARD